MTHSWKVSVQLMRESTCLYVSVLNIESSYLTSIHFKTSIQWRRERQKRLFFFIVGVDRSLISSTLLSLQASTVSHVHCRLVLVSRALNRPSMDESLADSGPPVSFLEVGELLCSLKIHTGEEPSDQWLSFLKDLSSKRVSLFLRV